MVLLFSLDVFISNFGNADEGNQPLQVLMGLVAGGLQTGPEVIKLFSCSTQLSTNFQLLIKGKMVKNKEFSCF